MEKKIAEALVSSFLQRLVQNEFRLEDTIPELERSAILEYVGAPPPELQGEEPTRAAPPKKLKRVDLNLACLKASPNPGQVVGFDFGTAFSKATFWPQNAGSPTPLELQKSALGTAGLLLASTLYVSTEAGKIIFGPSAIDVSRTEDIAGRERFDSPKQVLSIKGVEALTSRPPRQVDPTQSFSNRDLLTLYLGYLTAMVSDQLEAIGHDRHQNRRFAIPVWDTIQLTDTARLLQQMLVDGQILADTFSVTAWRDGLSIEEARSALNELGRLLPEGDKRRTQTKIVGQHVLEASAAAAAIGEKLQNKRPVALVMDVGAGTTDIGLFWFVFPDERSEKPPKIAPFKGGSLARKIAGDRMDALLAAFIRTKAGLVENDPVLYRVQRDIRDIKARLCLAGECRVEGIDDVKFQLSEFMSSPTVIAYRNELREAVGSIVSKFGASGIKVADGVYAVLTGGGSRLPLFDDFFEEPFATSDGPVRFSVIDARPDWLSALDPAWVPVFPQLAVAIGAGAPNLPSEAHPIGGVPDPNAHVRGITPTYR